MKIKIERIDFDTFSLFVDGHRKLTDKPKSVIVKTLKCFSVREPSLCLEIMQIENYDYIVIDKYKIVEGGTYGITNATRRAA